MYYAIVVGMLSVSTDIVEIILVDTQIVVVWIVDDILDTILNVICILCLRLLVSRCYCKAFLLSLLRSCICPCQTRVECRLM